MAKTTDIWQCPAFSTTLTEALDEFARTYWAQPRKVRAFEGGRELAASFQMVRGTGVVYDIRLDESGEQPLWIVSRSHDGRGE